MAKEWKKKGLVVIGVSDESFDLIDGYVEKHGVEFPIARLASGEFETAIGVEGFPTSAILNPKGELAWKGHPASADGPLSKHMKGSRRTALLPKEFSGIEKSLDKERKSLDKERSEVARLARSLNERDESITALKRESKENRLGTDMSWVIRHVWNCGSGWGAHLNSVPRPNCAKRDLGLSTGRFRARPSGRSSNTLRDRSHDQQDPGNRYRIHLPENLRA